MTIESQANMDIPLPRYYRPKSWILDEINKGNLKPGDRIPSERELCDRFGLSRGTVRQALGDLRKEGKVYFVRGRGTFVSEPSKKNWSIDTMISIADALEREGVPFETRVIEIGSKPACPSIAAHIQVMPGIAVMFLKRLRSIKGEPFMIATSYMPERLTTRLYSVDLNSYSLYGALEKACGIQVTYVHRVLCVRLIEDSEAALLGAPLGSAVQVIEGIAYQAGGSPVEYSEGVYRGDKSRFELQSRRTL